MSTNPLGKSVAVCDCLAELMLPVAVNAPVAGLYSSALPNPSPPATSTIPFGNKVAV
jgi:hypothetical protein